MQRKTISDRGDFERHHPAILDLLYLGVGISQATPYTLSNNPADDHHPSRLLMAKDNPAIAGNGLSRLEIFPSEEYPIKYHLQILTNL